MKLKQRPEDFYVEELTDVVPAGGPFAFYRLEKRGWGTPDALQAIRRRWKLEPRRLCYGGLKDRHAHTVQYFTVFHGPERKLTHQGFQVDYLGRVGAPYTSGHIRANRFRITLRDLQPAEAAVAAQVLEEVRADGVPNYFDDQRFGSVGEHHPFVARLMIEGQYEEALREALTAPYAHDRAAQKQEKAILRAHWGDWVGCKERLPRGDVRRLVDYLIHHPADFRGALTRLRPELRSLYLSAYQSYLWNRMLARFVEQVCRPEQIVPVRLRLGIVPMPHGLDATHREALAGTSLPLPSARLKLDPADPRLALVNAVLAADGLKLDEMKLKGMREMYFARGERAALCRPADLESETHADELHAGKLKLVLSCELPRGAYATLMVKRIQAVEC
jgi:tRNA pseudouridine13 synthase